MVLPAKTVFDWYFQLALYARGQSNVTRAWPDLQQGMTHRRVVQRRGAWHVPKPW